MADTTISKSYKDIYSFKECVVDTLVPTFFPDQDISTLNVGAIGLLAEMVGNTTEDIFNVQATLLQEVFPNKAQMAESIYAHAAIFQLDNLMATPCKCKYAFIIPEESIVKYGDYAKGADATYTLTIDNNTQFLVDTIPFTLDYDIIIQAKYNTSLGRYVYSCKYDIKYENSSSTTKEAFIPYRLSADGNLVMFIDCMQVEKKVEFENIINNSTINFPMLSFTFEDLLAGFDVFYKTPGTENWIQLKTLISNSPPISAAFCYYKIMDTDKFMIYFTTKTGYFQPVFNSDIKVIIYTTKGEGGKFETYTGTSAQVISTSENYPSNANIAMACVPVGSSIGGKNSYDLDALQSLTVEKYSSATVITNENDLKQYFYNYKYRHGNEIFPIKKRDDLVDKLYTLFGIFKNSDYIYPTNTLKVSMTSADIPALLNINNESFTIEPGRKFIYKAGSKDTIIPLKDGDTYGANDHVFTNPFMIAITKTPEACGYYLTTINQSAALVLENASNSSSFVQFIASKVNVNRPIYSKNYTISTSVLSSVESDDKYINSTTVLTDNLLRALCVVTNSEGIDIGFIEMTPSVSDSVITLTASVTTNDIVTKHGEFACTNLNKMGSTTDYVYAAMYNATLRIYVLYKNVQTPTVTNIFSTYDASLVGYDIIDTYSTKDDPITYIKPLSIIKSTASVAAGWEGGETPIPILIYDVPVIKYDIINNTDRFNYFLASILNQYLYMEESLDLLKNIMSIDLKFYNTYGKSKNFLIGDEQEELERVDLSASFKIKFTSTADTSTLVEQVKLFIKDYIENINNDVGGNDVYVSNLITALQNKFSDILYMKFNGFNSRSPEYQSIWNRTADVTAMNKAERQHYVPELLVIDVDNINIVTY